MGISSSGLLTIGAVGSGSSGSGGGYVHRAEHKAEEDRPVNVPASKIKYHKIKKHEKFMVKGTIPEYYISDIEVPKTNIDNLTKLSAKYRFVSFKIIDESKNHYVNSCYIIDYISSPVRLKGEGTKAIRSLVEKSMADKDTQGRILADVKITDNETSAAGFFYKLGFKFLDKAKNEAMDQWLRDDSMTLAPNLTGMMYLPKESIQKLLMYKMLL